MVSFHAELRASDKQYPVVMVVNGSNTPAKIYLPFFQRLASWGFVVVGMDDPQAGTGTSDDLGVTDINAEFGGVAPLASLVDIYNSIADDVLKIRARVTGAEHEQMQARTDGYMTAWMLYHLQGDQEAGKVFLGEDAEILHNSNWQDVEKNS